MMKSNIFNDTESVEVAANLARDAETGDDQGLEDIDIDYGADDNVTTSTNTPRSSTSTSTKVMGCMFLGGVACGATAGFAYGGVEANKAAMIQSRMSTAACSKAPKLTKAPKGTKAPKSSGSPVNPCDGMGGHFSGNSHGFSLDSWSVGSAILMDNGYFMCPMKASVIMDDFNAGNVFELAGMYNLKEKFMSLQGLVDNNVVAGGLWSKDMRYDIGFSDSTTNMYATPYYMSGWGTWTK